VYISLDNNALSGAGTSPQNKRPNAKAVASLKTDDASTQAKSAKSSANSTAAVISNAAKPQEADDNANTMADTAAVDISETFQCLQTGSDAEQLQQVGVVEDNMEKSSVQKVTDSSAAEAVVVAAANPVQSAESAVISGCQSSTEAAAERIERLKQPIDRTAGQMFTLAELFLLMSRPERIQLEYDWTLQQPGGHGTSAAAADEIEKQMSNQLRKLVDIAVAQFAMMNKQVTNQKIFFQLMNISQS
jgi:formylglycine-generating enzyme required for sulfatase activity